MRRYVTFVVSLACVAALALPAAAFAQDSAVVDQYPRGGIQTGGGSTADDGMRVLPLVAGGGLLVALTGGAALLAARRMT